MPACQGRPQADRVATRSAPDAPPGHSASPLPVAAVEDDPTSAAEEDGMDREDFWALIETAKTATGSDCRAQAAQLVAVLGERSVDEVLAWERIYGELMAESRS